MTSRTPCLILEKEAVDLSFQLFTFLIRNVSFFEFQGDNWGSLGLVRGEIGLAGWEPGKLGAWEHGELRGLAGSGSPRSLGSLAYCTRAKRTEALPAGNSLAEDPAPARISGVPRAEFRCSARKFPVFRATQGSSKSV